MDQAVKEEFDRAIDDLRTALEQFGRVVEHNVQPAPVLEPAAGEPPAADSSTRDYRP